MLGRSTPLVREKSIKTDLEASNFELWAADQSLAPPARITMLLRSLCESAKLSAVVTIAISST